MLADVTLRSLCKQIELFERAATYDGRPRERVVALGEAEELYFRLFPHHYRALQTIRLASQLGRMAADTSDPISRCESRLLSLLVRTILDAVHNGDLKLRQDQSSGELAFTIWVLAFGARALMDTKVATRQLGVENGFRVARHATEMLLDALGWQPLSTEWDYDRTRHRVRQVLFAEEWKQATKDPAAAGDANPEPGSGRPTGLLYPA